MGRVADAFRHLFGIARLRYFRPIAVLRTHGRRRFRDALAAAGRTPTLSGVGLSARATGVHRFRARPDGRPSVRQASLYLAGTADRAKRAADLLVADALGTARNRRRAPAPRLLIRNLAAHASSVSFTVSISTYSRIRRILPSSISKTKQ